MRDASVDAVVTDPPYGLAFMGKHWDHDVPGIDFWREALRVAKPGAYLLAFGGTRTFHRLVVAIEDAGWEVRDQIAWLYGSGFPKSHNLDGVWDGWGTALKPAMEPICVARKPLVGTVAKNVETFGTGALNIDGCRVGFVSEEDERESKAKNQHGDFGSGPMSNRVFGKFKEPRDNYAPPGRWPANVCHDGSDEVLAGFPDSDGSGPARTLRRRTRNEGWGMADAESHLPDAGSGSAARFFFRADCSPADRFLYQPKASRSERVATPDGTRHPTQKPVALMAYLCRLVTPPNGIVLDPFTGSGTTGVAAIREGFRFVGIEKEDTAEHPYVTIARARIGAAEMDSTSGGP